MVGSIHVRQYLCDLDRYIPGTPAELVARRHGLDPKTLVKLASNENPYGMSLKASAAAHEALKQGHRYPDEYGLIQAIAQFYSVDPGQVVLGNGSNNLLDLIARTFLTEGTEAVASEYAYAYYKIVTLITGGTYKVAPSLNFGYDLQAMLAAITPQTRIVWLNNPANPTGTFLPYEEIRQFIAKVPADVIVVLDEAYGEFLKGSDRFDTMPWLKEFPNLVLLRTFSKIYGLAGLRVGYGIATPDLADILNRVAPPFNHNGPALAAATAALSDRAFVDFCAAGNADCREQLRKGLEQLGLELLPSYGNFVTARTGRAADIAHELEARGIITRPLVAYGLHDWLRISVGMHHQNSRVLAELPKVLSIDDLSARNYSVTSISDL